MTTHVSPYNVPFRRRTISVEVARDLHLEFAFWRPVERLPIEGGVYIWTAPAARRVLILPTNHIELGPHYSLPALYTGQTNNFNRRKGEELSDAIFGAKLQMHNHRFLLIYPEESEETREILEKALIARYDPPLNILMRSTSSRA